LARRGTLSFYQVPDGSLHLGTSPALLIELERVLQYPKLGLDPHQIQTFINAVRAHSTVVEPQETLRIISADPDDDRVLECAVAVSAHWIVSGDKHLLTLGSFNGIHRLTATDALRLLDDLR
jgi:uncharacterized protein